MFKIAGTLPVKTRLPFVAWALAGLVTIFSLVTSFEISDFQSRGASKHFRDGAQYASITDLLKVLAAL